MSIDPNLLIAAKIVHDECDKNICCNKCQLCDICYDTCPDDWNIPEPPPEPTERPRIEWLRMLPDKEILMAAYEARWDSDSWWHNAVTLKQFRKDVGLE